jgi:hypothetical protein
MVKKRSLGFPFFLFHTSISHFCPKLSRSLGSCISYQHLSSISVEACLPSLCAPSAPHLAAVLWLNSVASLSFVSLSFTCPGDSDMQDTGRQKGLGKGSCETTGWSRDLTQGRERSKDPNYPLETFHA